MKRKGHIVVLAVTLGTLTACSGAPEYLTVDEMREHAQKTGMVLGDEVIPNDTYAGWYVFSTPDRPYPNAAGFLLERDTGSSPVCVRQDTEGASSVEVTPAACPPTAGTDESSDAEFALLSVLFRARVLAEREGLETQVYAIEAAEKQLREEGHALEVTTTKPGEIEVRVGDNYACRVETEAEITTYVGKCG